MIGMDGERESGNSVLSIQLDDGDIIIDIIIAIFYKDGFGIK